MTKGLKFEYVKIRVSQPVLVISKFQINLPTLPKADLTKSITGLDKESAHPLH